MVRITRVYTGGGDSGETSLVDGSRLSKGDLRFEIVGTCDELNAIFGLIRSASKNLPEHIDGGDSTAIQRVQVLIDNVVPRIQSELFDLGAEMACEPDKLPEYMVLIGQEQCDALCNEMDALLESLDPLTSFILPAGDGPDSMLHLARVVTRRLERAMVRLKDSKGDEAVRSQALVYVNRLSDWCFVMGRWVGKNLANEESEWLPLGKRGSEKGASDLIRKMQANDADFNNL